MQAKGPQFANEIQSQWVAEFNEHEKLEEAAEWMKRLDKMLKEGSEKNQLISDFEEAQMLDEQESLVTMVFFY